MPQKLLFHRVIQRKESGHYDFLKPGYHASIGRNYFVTEDYCATEKSREETVHCDSLEPRYQGSIGKNYSATE